MKNRSFHQHGSFVVSCREPFGNFPAETSTQFPPKWEGNFPKPVNLSIHNRSDIKTSLGFFSQLGLFVWLFMTLWNFERNIRKFPCGNIPGDSLGKRGRNIHIENSPLFLLNFCWEIMRKFPWGWSPEIPPSFHAEIWGTWLACPLGSLNVVRYVW